MTESPLVSMIIPCFQEASFILGVIRDIQTQTYPEDRWEAIFVDGGSTDGTIDLIQQEAAKDRRLRLLDNPDRYVPQAMNRGIRAAKGSIIVRLDAPCLLPRLLCIRPGGSLTKIRR